MAGSNLKTKVYFYLNKIPPKTKNPKVNKNKNWENKEVL